MAAAIILGLLTRLGLDPGILDWALLNAGLYTQCLEYLEDMVCAADSRDSSLIKSLSIAEAEAFDSPLRFAQLQSTLAIGRPRAVCVSVLVR